jgi:hypothetical protein
MFENTVKCIPKSSTLAGAQKHFSNAEISTAGGCHGGDSEVLAGMI